MAGWCRRGGIRTGGGRLIVAPTAVVIATAVALAGVADPSPGHALPVREGREAPPPSPTVPVGIYTDTGPLSAEQVAALAGRAGWPAELVDDVVAIAWRESRNDPHAVNVTSGACGLMQLYPCPGPEAMAPLGNLLLARSKCLAASVRGDCLDPWR